MRIGITYRFDDRLVPYAEAIRHVGLNVVGLHPEGVHTLDGLDGLLLSGGTDVNPKRYGETPHPLLEDPDDARDSMEIDLLRQAIKSDMPILAICRGLQLLNVAQGGNLFQHLPNTPDHQQRGVTDVHSVETESGSKLRAIAGAHTFAVNSRHHQAVERLGTGLVVSAKSTDGVIEGLELPGRRFAVAVQWHPEDRVPLRRPDTMLFRAFAQAVRE